MELFVSQMFGNPTQILILITMLSPVALFWLGWPLVMCICGACSRVHSSVLDVPVSVQIAKAHLLLSRFSGTLSFMIQSFLFHILYYFWWEIQMKTWFFDEVFKLYWFSLIRIPILLVLCTVWKENHICS